jgi:hypothetical protein
MRFWSMQGGWVEPLAKRNNLQLELFKQVNGSPLYLANQLSILSLGYLKHWLIFFVVLFFNTLL